MAWIVNFGRKADKQYDSLPRVVQDRIDLLAAEIETLGPVRGNWKNYSKLGNRKHHCHVKTGKPTYVAVWEEIEDVIKFVEVQYVGTHEKAPY